MNDDDVVKAAIRFMWLNYQHEINLDRIAAHAMYSKFYFLRRFKASTGVTPGRFLTTIRLARSKQMLAREPDLSVTDIAMAVGYDSSGAFSTKFRQVVGMTPSDYRAVHLQDGGHSDLAGRLAAGSLGSIEEDVVRREGRLSGFRPDGLTDTFVGLFEGTAPQGLPIGCAVVSGRDRLFDLQVPPGRWNVMAVSFAGDAEGAVAVGSTGMLDFTLGAPKVDLVVEMRDDVDHALPVLGAFPEFHALRQHSQLQQVV